MAWFKCSGGGIPALLKTRMNNVFNKKFGTSTTYQPDGWPDNVNLMGPLEEKTVSGSIVAFSDGADDVPLKSCAVTIAPTLDGVSSVGVVQTGANLLFNNIEDGTTGGIGYTKQSDGSIACSGTVSNVNATRLINTVVLPIGNYVLSGADSSINLRAVLYDGEGAVITNRNDTGSGVTISIDNTVSHIEVRIKARTNAEQVSTTIFPMLAVGSTPQTYEKYNGTNHTANLGRTIYGGTADVVNGTGTETWRKIIIDGDTVKCNGIYGANGNALPRLIMDADYYHSGVATDILSTYLTPSSSVINDEDSIALVSSGTSIAVHIGTIQGNDGTHGYNSSAELLAAANAYLQSHNLTVVYKLSDANATDFTFTAVPIISRLGDNTLWSDDGDLNVVYRSSGTQTLIPPTLISKTITANGNYSAEDDGADGYDEVTVSVSGGGGNTPQATQTLICDNSALGSSLTFTDDYENYDLIMFVVYRSDIGNQFTFYMTPAMINAMGQYSSNRINFNQPYGNNFVCYTKTSNTAWTRYGVRNLAVKYVYGLTFTNCTVTETELYNRQGIGSSNVTFTPPTGETFLDYDYILLATCTGNSDETQVNLDVFQPDIEKDIFGSDNADENSVRVYKYNQGGTFVTVTENTITAFSYFYACGLKLSYNQQNLLGGFNSNSEQGEQENEIENELNELEQEESENESNE